MSTPAVFLDRDGTLVYARHYPSRPQDLVLYNGVVPRLKRLKERGYRLVVITNQSGLARGYFTHDDLDEMHDHLLRDLDVQQVNIDGIYYCPHHPDGMVPELAIRCDCRKPQPGMLFQAAEDLDIDLKRSWFVGDILDDVEAGKRAGCATVLVDLGTEGPPKRPTRRPDYVARDTCHALDIILTGTSNTAHAIGVDHDYIPASWSRKTELSAQS